MTPSRLLLALVLLAQSCFPAERWAMQFFHDEDKSSLTINDLQFASATRGVAVGYLTEKQKIIPTAVVTSDGGKNWTLVRTKEAGLSVFFLNDQSGWMVTDKGIWSTDEAGRTWKKIHKREGLLRVHFLSAEHGWAIGAGKTVVETIDAGKTWTKVKEVEESALNPITTVFTWVDFSTPKKGIIVGHSAPMRRSRRPDLPIWMDTEPEKRREAPKASIFLETIDGGATWTRQMSSLFGSIGRFRLGKLGRGLALINYENYFQVPSEVLRLDLTTGKNTTTLRRKDRAITDVGLVEGGPSFAAGFEPVGSIAYSPVPGAVKVLRSNDMITWTDMPVDYRAVAHNVMMSVVDADHIWLATDTGMILKLTN